MDIRDVKEVPTIIRDGKYLEEIYDLQTQLLNHYVKIEGIPLWPVDVNTKKNQVLLKDFTGRVTEELAEGYESHLMVEQLTNANNLWFNDFEREKYVEMISHLQNLNEEQADAMHFMVELLLYVNILPEDIQAWINIAVKELGISDIKKFTTPDILHNAMVLGTVSNKEYFGELKGFSKPTSLIDEVEEEVLAYVPGGRLYSPLLLSASKSCLWDVTYALNISRNCLKNKPWKQTGVMTNESLYQSKLIEAFIYMMGYWARLGLNSETVYYLYFKKNKINCFRISSKY